MPRHFGLLTLLPLQLALVDSAWAQSADELLPDGAEADPFEVSSSLASGQGTLQGESSQLGAEGLQLGLLASYAQNPLVRVFEDGRREPVGASFLPVTLQGGYTVKDWFRVDLIVPFYAYVKVNETSATAPWSGPAFGDLRLQGTFPVYAAENGMFRFGVVPRIGIPTGLPKAQVTRGPNAQVLLTASGDTPVNIGWVANLGATLAPVHRLEGARIGSTADAIVGLWWTPIDTVRLGAEADFHVGLARAPNEVTLRSEGNDVGNVHGFVQAVHPTGLGLTVGAGGGVLTGVGSPEYRLFSGLTWMKVENDKDGDGLLDKVDGCPLDPEDFDQWQDEDGCPEADNDGDTILDGVDACMNVAEDADGWQDTDGCVDPDNDLDQVIDADDACRDVPGHASLNGCPDRDGDQIGDGEDSCPDDAGPAKYKGCPDIDNDEVPIPQDLCPNEPKNPAEPAATSDGCPKAAFLDKGRIVITDKVYFATGKAVIEERSYDILAAVAQVIRDNPKVSKLEVQGHTDDTGSDKANQTLSQSRAKAVMDYLAAKEGIDKKRLTAKGYGEVDPIDTNKTEKGRGNNRRVEFVLLEEGAAPVKPVPAPVPVKPVPVKPEPVKPAPKPEPAKPVPAPVPVKPEPVKPAPTTIQPVPAPGPRPKAIVDPNAKTAFLTVKVRSGGYATVFVDNVKLQKTAPFVKVDLPPGKHLVWVSNFKLGLDYTEEIEVVAGEERTIVVVPGAPNGGAAPADDPWLTPVAPAPGPAPGAPPAPAPGGDKSPWDR